MHYLKFQIPYKVIREYLQAGGYSKIIFHVDLPSIARGFYNKDVVQYEITNYMTTKQNPVLFFTESKQFLGKIYEQFAQFSPRFNIFYDNGECKQNKSIFNGYKNRASGSSKLMLEDVELELYHQIKQYYYNEFVERFTNPVSRVTFLQEYEADFIPWILMTNNIWGSAQPDTLNVILSTDKDLLQCCKFGNCIQIMTLYSTRESKILFNVYNDQNAISQIYEKFDRGILTSIYVPLILAISGDKADKIPGIPKVGPAGAYKMILNHNLPPAINDFTPLPSDLEPHRKLIVRNYKLISFEEQLKRIPLNVLEKLKNDLTL